MQIKKLNSGTHQTRYVRIFLLVSVIVFVTAACGSAQAANSDSSASISLLNGASVAAPQKVEEAQPAEGGSVQNPGAVSSEQIKQPAQSPDAQSIPAVDAPVPVAQDEAIKAPGASANNEPSAPAPVGEVQPVEDLPPAEPHVGFLAPDITLQTLDGRTVNLSDFRGQPVVVNYWASWCIPCQAELPILESIYRDYQQQGVIILSINAIEQDNMNDMQQTVSQHGLTYPVLLDEGETFWTTYQVLFFPTSYMIDRNGIIREIVLGDTTEESFRAKVDQLVAGAY